MSADGRYVAFLSDASNLVPGDTNGVTDLFVRDNATRQVRRASLAADGSQLSAGTTQGSIGGDGRYVFFHTSAVATAEDADGSADLYRRDLVTGTTVLASVPPAGTADQPWSAVGWSGNGRYVAFGGSAGTYRRDLTAGVATPLPDAGTVVDVADDGTVLTLHTDSSVGTFRWSFTAPDGTLEPGPASTWQSTWFSPVQLQTDMSPDGRFLAGTDYTSSGQLDVWVYDRSTGTKRYAPGNEFGGGALPMELSPSISADGRFVAYRRGTGGRTGEFGSDLVVHDFERGTSTTLLDLPSDDFSPEDWRAELSDDGRWTALLTGSATRDPGGVPQVVVRFAHDPWISAASRPSVGPGTHTVTLQVGETVGTPRFAASGRDVSVDAVRSTGPGTVELDLTVAPDAEPGPRDLIIKNRGDWGSRIVVGAIRTCTGCLTVTT